MCGPASCWPCSVRTAPARARRSACCSALPIPTPARRACSAQSPHALDARRRVGVMLQSAGMPDTLKVGELLAQTRSYYPDPLERRRMRRDGRHRRSARSPLRQVVRRTAAARAVRARDLWAAAAAVSRRADGRPRRRSAPGVVGDDALARRGRLRGAADDALSRRSRSARRSRRRARARPHRRRRQRAPDPRARRAAAHPLRVGARARNDQRVARRAQHLPRRRSLRDRDRRRRKRRAPAALARTRASASSKCSAPALPKRSSKSPRRPRDECDRPNRCRASRSPRVYALESKHEFLRLLRAPSFAVPTLMFPPMFYLLVRGAVRRAATAISTRTFICSRHTACSA